MGAAVGLSGFTFTYAEGASYLSTDPRACTNCHVMNEQYDGWLKSSHHAVATCNDCHAPHSTAGKLWTKAQNGFFHSLHFTLGTYPDPIRIKPGNLSVTEGTCKSCHASLTDNLHADADCVGCHRSVGHLH